MESIQHKIALKASSLHKNFKIPLEKKSGLKELLIRFYKRKRGHRDFHVLNDINFEVHKGDFFGIVGRNGSGKSTLLKIISQIYQPTKGGVVVNGSLMPFIELGVGFNTELSAKDNVYLNGAMIGFSRHEIDDMYKSIVDFAELHGFMDEQLKNFSSGMKVRLAFSIAIQAKSDILVLDEVLAVGDEAFRQKCNDFFLSQKGTRTIILVTHDMNAIQKFCNRGIFLNDGRVEKYGTSSEIAEAYSNLFLDEKIKKIKKLNGQKKKKTGLETLVSKISVMQNGKQTARVMAYQDFSLKVNVKSRNKNDNIVVAINIFNEANNLLLAASTKHTKSFKGLSAGETEIMFDIQNIYTDGEYRIAVAMASNDELNELLYQDTSAHRFVLEGIKHMKYSLTHPNVKVSSRGV